MKPPDSRRIRGTHRTFVVTPLVDHKGVPVREVRGRTFPGPLLDEPDPPKFVLELFQALN